MTPNASAAVAELMATLSSFASAYHAAQEAARAVGEEFGIEVLDVRPHARGEWEIRLRPTSPVAKPHAMSATLEEAPTRVRPLPPAVPFESPAPASRPFDGDGTAELTRFIAAADPVCSVPPRGARRALPPLLLVEARLPMLAETIAGDALLSLRHQVLHRDPARVDAALRESRVHYEAEVARAVEPSRADEFIALYQSAAAEARQHLLEED